ncbi:hypothetical protein ATI61_12374 [Archangium gephyra]|uniref:Uncharacterized protein n=2 Tax=Archangium gephyra TaxID=48 RepID=A0AAC8QHL0_9BACT|nr:Hypothetical protein AA314_09105 [Archangium gephyra]REG19123.1 hypothetical protein ATI61_12374 [Archangium gephyra]
MAGTTVYEVEVLEPGHAATRPVSIGRAEFQRSFQRLVREVQLGNKTPQEAARELLKGQVEQPAEWQQLEGVWLAEVYKDRVLTLVPQDENSRLIPEADEALRSRYVQWCARRGGGDCLHLFDDGPYLRTDDRRTLALALSFGSVLEETLEALGREVNPRAVVATCLWTVSLYLALWLVPEPTTKALAASLSVILVAWLGVDTVWGLMDGWARLATQAHQATTFEELREAGEQFAKVLGKDAARTMLLAVGALTGRTLGEVAARVRSLPGYSAAGAQWEAQGGAAVLGRLQVREMGVAREGALAAAVEAVEMVVATPEGAVAVAVLSQNGSASAAGPAPGGNSVTTVLRHRGGNQQVVLGNGQRWHLPRGRSPQDIPAEDPLGDELQAAANQVAKQWGPGELTRDEKAAINEAIEAGNYFQASRLEGQARGRWVEAQLRELFKHLKWKRQGVDITGPNGQEYHYEVLAGSADNFGRHGRRMYDVFFRMIFF